MSNLFSINEILNQNSNFNFVFMVEYMNCAYYDNLIKISETENTMTFIRVYDNSTEFLKFVLYFEEKTLIKYQIFNQKKENNNIKTLNEKNVEVQYHENIISLINKESNKTFVTIKKTNNSIIIRHRNFIGTNEYIYENDKCVKIKYYDGLEINDDTYLGHDLITYKNGNVYVQGSESPVVCEHKYFNDIFLKVIKH